jgi:hypothetical protein
MFYSLWNQLTWRVILGAAILSVAIYGYAQPSPSSNESSSASSFQVASANGQGSLGAIPKYSTIDQSEMSSEGSAPAVNWKKQKSSIIAAEVGGGFNAPIGNDNSFISWGGNFTVGGGVHLNDYVSLLAEYQFMGNGLPDWLAADAGSDGGHVHIWSLTLSPVVDLFPHETNSVYLTGGGGFYRKVTSFTDQVAVYDCYYFCYVDTANVVVGHFSSNQGGMNVGFGLTHKLGGKFGSGRTKVFAEARYLFLDTPKIGETNGLGTTGLVPVTFGLRW